MGNNDNILVKIDEKEYSAKKGKTIIEICADNGISVPHFCYHKYLSIAGNCRMCLVNVEGIPKPVISCATVASDGMVVDTSSDSVLKLRESIMEFLLINHPLDCPVCDKAGECDLQNYSYDYGRDIGRFSDDKVVKKVKDFGFHVKYWGSRCIVCTRCVRFTDEVSGTGELSVINRSDKSSIDIHPDFPLNNPLSMNVNDVCPVGALVSSDFLYEARVWNMSCKDSVCNSCSVACNIRVDSLDNKIKRIVPRENKEINKLFICDYGRLNFEYVYSEKRIKRPFNKGEKSSWSKMFEGLKSRILDKDYVKKLAIVVSTWNTNEALYLIKKLRDEFLKGSAIYFYSKHKEEDQLFPGFRISGDKSPNVNGIKAIFGKDSKISYDVVLPNSVENIVFVGGIDTAYIPPSIVSFMDRFKDIVVIDYIESVLSKRADLLFSSLSHYEQEGSYINDKLILQKYAPVIEPVTFGMPLSSILLKLFALLEEGVLEKDIEAEMSAKLY